MGKKSVADEEHAWPPQVRVARLDIRLLRHLELGDGRGERKMEEETTIKGYLARERQGTREGGKKMMNRKKREARSEFLVCGEQMLERDVVLNPEERRSCKKQR